MSTEKESPSYISVSRAPSAPTTAILTIKRAPVNSMNLQLWQELLSTLTDLESPNLHNDPPYTSLIIRSGLDRPVFTAGNDINELYAPATSEPRYTDFWVTSITFLARLYRSPLVTVAAIHGACPAGGCALALCCDYRIVVSGEGLSAFAMGLNEVALGIPVPAYWARLFARVVGQNVAEKTLFRAKMMGAKEAVKVGLVDRVVGTVEELVPGALEYVGGELTRSAAQRAARATTKMALRGEFAIGWEKQAREEAAGAWKMLSEPSTAKALEMVMKRLAKSKI